MISMEDICLGCGSEEVFEEGKRLLKKKRVDELDIRSFWKSESEVKTSVRDDDGLVYPVTVTVRDEKVIQVNCACGKAEEGYYCAHGAAAVMSYAAQAEKLRSPFIVTSSQLRTMERNYRDIEKTSAYCRLTDNKIILKPFMTFREDGVLNLTFSMLADKEYPVKNIIEFVQNMQAHQLVSYGRNLSFYHVTDAFDPSCRGVLKFLIQWVTRFRGWQETYQPFGRKTAALKELRLLPVDLDELLLHSDIDNIDICIFGQEPVNMPIRNENPSLRLILSHKGRNGYALSMPETLSCIPGSKRMFCLKKDALYCPDEEFSEALRPFFTQMMELPRSNRELLIQNKDMPEFCRRILPEIQKFLQVEIEADLSEFDAPVLENVFFVDSVDRSQMTLQIEYHYDDNIIIPGLGDRPDDVCRDISGELMAELMVKSYFPVKDEARSLYIVKGDDAIYRFITEGFDKLSEIGNVVLSEEAASWKAVRPPHIQVVSVSADSHLELTLDTSAWTDEELEEALVQYRSRKKYMRLADGRFVNLDDENFLLYARLREDYKVDAQTLKTGKTVLTKTQAWTLYRSIDDGGSPKEYFPAIRSLADTLSEAVRNPEPVPAEMAEVLRDYQKDGFRWMRTLMDNGFGGILADEMGLGKTIQIIALLKNIKQRTGRLKAMVVCPASLVFNWENEIKRFAPDISAFPVTGNQQEREERLEQVVSSDAVEVAITSYDLLKRDIAKYEELVFQVVVVDEAQYIKNPSTQAAKSVKRLQAEARFALTGTPVENRLEDLWSISDFLNHGLLYGYSRFGSEYVKPIVKEENQDAMKRLRRIIGPFILRRYKRQVLTELPPKLETVVYSRLDGEQSRLYSAYAKQMRDQLEGRDDGDISRDRMQILAELTRLRQICCDPALCFENYSSGSAKTDTCVELLSEAISAGHRILVFSQFASMLRLLQSRLEEEKIGSFLMTGSTPTQERLHLVERFNQGEAPVFLISLKAGGTGLNLTGADTVIHFDPWWNAAAENQASDRAHRIGQTKVVTVIRLVTKNTIEENILTLQQRKADLAGSVMGGAVESMAAFNRDDLLEILRQD